MTLTVEGYQNVLLNNCIDKKARVLLDFICMCKVTIFITVSLFLEYKVVFMRSEFFKDMDYG